MENGNCKLVCPEGELDPVFSRSPLIILNRNYGLDLGLGGPIGDYIEFWGGPLRDILQI